MSQESPPISPLLYQPGGAFAAAAAVPPGHAPQLHQPPGSALHQYSSLAPPKPAAMSTSVPEIWVQKSEYTGVAGGPSFEVSSAPVGYGVHPGMKAATAVLPTQQHQPVIQTPQSQPQVSVFGVAKVEQAHSPAEIMEIQP